MYSRPYDILFFRSVHCIQKEETVADTSLPIWGGLKRVWREVEKMVVQLDNVHTLIQNRYLAHDLESQER